jgi:hypothetical protein
VPTRRGFGRRKASLSLSEPRSWVSGFKPPDRRSEKPDQPQLRCCRGRDCVSVLKLGSCRRLRKGWKRTGVHNPVLAPNLAVGPMIVCHAKPRSTTGVWSLPQYCLFAFMHGSLIQIPRLWKRASETRRTVF